jgi:hypothetical protein
MAFPDISKAQSSIARVFGIIDRKSPIDPETSEGRNEFRLRKSE